MSAPHNALIQKREFSSVEVCVQKLGSISPLDRFPSCDKAVTHDLPADAFKGDMAEARTPLSAPRRWRLSLLHLWHVQVSACKRLILSDRCEDDGSPGLLKIGGKDKISVMTPHIALNCFIGKMIVLFQFK